jgi:cytochrome P450
MGFKLRHIPGPPGFPIIGHIPFLLSKPWLRFQQYYERYGKVFKIFLWTEPMIFINDPGAIKDILVMKMDNFRKDKASYNVFGGVLGQGLVTAEGERWKVGRKIMSPTFHMTTLGDLMPVFTRATDRMITDMRGLASGAKFEISDRIRQLTLEVISEVALGLDCTQAQVLPDLFQDVLDEMNLRVMHPYRAFFPSNSAHVAKVKELDDLVLTIIAKRRAELAELKPGEKPTHREPDILDMLLNADAELSDRQLADECKTMLLAGHETTSTMLTWTLYCLAKTPRAMAEAVRASDALASGENDMHAYGSFEEYKGDATEYLHQCLQEGLRLYTPVPVLTREVVGDIELAGTLIPAGSRLAMGAWNLTHCKETWGEDAEEFRPERFSKEEKRGRNPYVFFPFSLGSRNCVGQNLALIEGRVVLSTLLRLFTFTLPEDSDVKTDGHTIPVRPADGLWIQVTPRPQYRDERE